MKVKQKVKKPTKTPKPTGPSKFGRELETHFQNAVRVAQRHGVAIVDHTDPAPGYHLTAIERGKFGEASKVREEVEEFIDAVEQGVRIMALLELGDLIGAIEGYLAKHQPDITIYDIIKMKDVTARAFTNGHRKGSPDV